jgi:hypothetical protein
MTQLSISSWEFFTTLDYEWSVIRGRRPYRWTIWVRNRSQMRFGFHCPRWILGSLTLICFSPAGLFSYARGRSLDCDTRHGPSRRYGVF